MPNDFVNEPWGIGTQVIALNEFECTEYAELIKFTLQDGGVEINEQQYQDSQPDPYVFNIPTMINNE